MEGHRRGPIVSVWLRNNIRVHYMKMDVPPGAVCITINLLGGVMREDRSNRGISLVSAGAWDRVSIRDLSEQELAGALEGKNVRFEGTAAADAMCLRVWGSRADIETGMQVATLLLTRPEVSVQDVGRAAERAGRDVRAERVMQGLIARNLARVLFPADEVRAHPAKREQVEAITVPQAQAWLDEHVRSAPIEAAIVGDLSLEQALELAGGFLGTLPERERVGPATMESLRRLPAPKYPIVVEPAPGHIGEAEDEVLVLVGFAGPDVASTRDLRSLRLAGEVLDDRVSRALAFARVIDPPSSRPTTASGEPKTDAAGVSTDGKTMDSAAGSDASSPTAWGAEQGRTSEPAKADEQRALVGVSVVPGTPYPGFGAVVVSCRVKASKGARAAEVIEREIAAAGSLGRLRPDELEDARTELVRRAEQANMDPRYWSAILAKATTIGMDIDEAADGAGFYRELSADGAVDVNKALIREGVNDVLRRYIGAGRSIRVIVPIAKS